MEKMRFEVSAECCESFARTDVQGRLFQIAGAAERKPRAPNEMLQRVTERRLAEADRRFLDGVCSAIVCYLRQRRRYMFLPAFVVLSVFLLARLVKNACMDLDECCMSSGHGRTD